MDYDNIAQEFDTYDNEAVTDWLGFERVTEFLTPVSGRHVLDYGVGSGRFARFLVKQGARVTGVDISQELINRAQEDTNANVSYHHIAENADLSAFENDSFDAAVSAFVVAGIKENTEISMLFQEIYRVLTPGGYFVILDNNWEQCAGRSYQSCVLHACPEAEGEEVEVLLKTNEKEPLSVKEYYRPARFYEELLSEAGFSGVQTEYVKAETDDPAWMAEADCPPFHMIYGKKE